MAILDNIESRVTLPNEILHEMIKVDVFKKSAIHSLLVLIENKWREHNKENFFELTSGHWIRANEDQKIKIKNHLTDIKDNISRHYWWEYTDLYLDEIIMNLFPKEYELIINIRKQLTTALSS